MSSRRRAWYGSWNPSQAIRDPRVEFADKSDLTADIDIPDKAPVFVGTYSHILKGYCRGHKVAIKVIRVVTQVLSSMRRKVSRELDVWGHLDHPNIVPLYGYTEPSQLFGDFGAFISPWYESGDAAKFLRDCGPSLTMDQRYILWEGVITGVTYLHTHIPVIVHGDLKPGNILIDDEGNPRICDFGLCSIFIEDGHSGMTTTTEHAGTERYLAPELITSPDARPTAASDVYALGCIGLEFLFLQHPYSNLKSNRNGMITLEIMKGTPPALRPSDLNQEIDILWDALEACWQWTPSMRIPASNLLTRAKSLSMSTSPSLSYAPKTSKLMTKNADGEPVGVTDGDDDHQDEIVQLMNGMMANTDLNDSAKLESSAPTLRKRPSLKWAPYRGSRSPTKTEHELPSSEPLASEHYIPPTKPSDEDALPLAVTPSIALTDLSASHQARGDSSNGPDIRSFKVSLEDPAWKVLPAALKKYKINNDDWKNYVMFICYGTTERCLSYEEKPILLYYKLKEAKKNPVFMLKHIRDIRSPIAVAQQKQAARREKEQNAQRLATPPTSQLHSEQFPVITRTGSNGSTSSTAPLATANLNVISTTVQADESSHGDANIRATQAANNSHLENLHGPSQPVLTQSYAIAIYPYSANHEDEFDVQVNDTFIINSRARGWWIVQKDPTGTGHPDEGGHQGWAPAGCFLETNLPVAHAIQEASARHNGYGRDPDRTPIMPSSIVSTSYPGIALMEYRKKGEEELDLVKDDALRVFKRYNHWSYAVKEHNGDRGWIPSWFISKIGPVVPGIPPTPAPQTTSTTSGNSTVTMTESDLRYALDGPAASPFSPGYMHTQQH